MRVAYEQITPRIEEEMSVADWMETELFHEQFDFLKLRPCPNDKRLGDSDARTGGIFHKTDDTGIIFEKLIRPCPAIQIFQGRGRRESDGTGAESERIAAEAGEGDFDDSLSHVIENHLVLHSWTETW